MRRLVPLACENDQHVPITWPCAQHTAAGLIVQASTSPQTPSRFEYRATHDVLALTILLTSADAPAKKSWDDQLRVMMALLEYDVEWALWCSGLLLRAPACLSASDLGAASSAWTWLTRSRLLSGSLSHRLGASTGTETHPGSGLTIGVALAHRSLSAISTDQ